MEQLATNLFLFIGITMFIFAGLQMTARRRTEVNLALCGLFAAFGFVWLYYGLYRYNRLQPFPWLLYADVPVTYLIGPLFFNYTRCLMGRKRPVHSYNTLPYLPALLSLVYLIFIHATGQVSAAALTGLNPDHFQIPGIRVINTLGDLQFFIYGLISIIMLIRERKQAPAGQKGRFRTTLIFYGFGFALFAVFFAGHVLKSDSLLGLAVLANGINAIYFFFMSYRYPEYTQQTVLVRLTPKKKAAVLNSLNVPSLLARLENIMSSDQGFRDPRISVQSLSTLLGIQNHQLSRILKDYLGCNFRSYINRLRLTEAQRLLAEEPELTILDVAYTVGFNSKSAFNSAFVKETGETPSNYRKTTVKTS